MMPITRVADQYGYLEANAERQAFNEAHEAEAREIAAAHRSHSLTAGLNDPRRMAYERAKLAEMGAQYHYADITPDPAPDTGNLGQAAGGPAPALPPAGGFSAAPAAPAGGMAGQAAGMGNINGYPTARRYEADWGDNPNAGSDLNYSYLTSAPGQEEGSLGPPGVGEGVGTSFLPNGSPLQPVAARHDDEDGDEDSDDGFGGKKAPPFGSKDSRRHYAGDSVEVSSIPSCDICKYDEHRDTPAAYDGKTKMGPWANMCEKHFKSHGVGLGTGQGQRLVQREGRRLYAHDAAEDHRHRHEDMGYSPEDVARLKDNHTDPSWESGLDRPFTAAYDGLDRAW